MKKILIVASVASMIDQFNGVNIEVLEELGYRIDIACNFESGNTTSDNRIKEFKEELKEKSITIHQLPIPRNIFSLKKILKSYKEIKRVINRTDYDIIHCHSPIGSALARLASINFKKKRMEIIYTAHGFHFYHGAPFKNWIIYYPIEKVLSLITSYLITINREDYIIAKNHFHAKRTKYIPGIGINTKPYILSLHDKNEIMKEFSLKNENIILSVGELNENKNHEVIIRSISQIKHPIKYIIVGKGELDTYLKKLVEELGVEDKVILTGYRNDVKALLAMSDIFCFPSYREGLSVALMEAMASGKPIVCSNIRGNKDLIIEGKGGYLCDPKDIKAFSEAINYMLDHKYLRDSMSMYNKSRIEKFDEVNVKELLKEIYVECEDN